MNQKYWSLVAALLAAPLAEGHYIFSQLLVNGSPEGADYDYIRKNTNTYQPSYTDEVIGSPNLICNKGANTVSSKTYKAKAGDTIGAQLSGGEKIEHPGPGEASLSNRVVSRLTVL